MYLNLKRTTKYSHARLHHNLAKSIMLCSNGKIRTKKWILKKAQTNFFYLVQNDFDKAEAFANQMEVMMNVLTSVHGDKWDIHISVVTSYDDSIDRKVFKGFQLNFVIHYPKLTITNSNGKSHNIKDLLVLIPIDQKCNNTENGIVGFGSSTIYGTRYHQSYIEWFHGYLHSHLETLGQFKEYDRLGVLRDFCLGQNEVNDLLSSNLFNFSDNAFELLLHTITSMMEWESLEGVPWITFEDVLPCTNHEVNSYEISHSDRDACSTVERILLDKNIDLELMILDGKLKVKESSSFKNVLKELFKTEYDLKRYVKTIIVAKNTKGKYYGYEVPQIRTRKEINLLISDSNKERPVYYIQGKKLEYSVDTFEGELPSIDNYQIIPKFLNYAAKELSKELQDKQIRRSIISEHYKAQSK